MKNCFHLIAAVAYHPLSMRLLAVRLQNLNSLSGVHEVRFDVVPLSGVGVFLITGPTNRPLTSHWLGVLFVVV